MKTAALVLVCGMAVSGAASAQKAEEAMQKADAKSGMQQPDMQMSEDAGAPKPGAAQSKAAEAYASKAIAEMAPKPVATAGALTPLNPRERTVQLLDRFTYGARPGDVDRVMAMGADKWFAQQMNPDAIPDKQLDKRLADYPTVAMSPAQAMMVFPDGGQVEAVAKGQAPYPSDPLLLADMEVQVVKYNQRRDIAKPDGTHVPQQEPSDEEKAAKKKADTARAQELAGVLLAMPKDKRMAAIEKMPVEDRIALTNDGDLMYEQKTALMADFNPRERETFLAMSRSNFASYVLRDELAEAHLLRDILSERQLQTVMTNFWFNHFNVYQQKNSDAWYTPTYEREVIRKNALGSFKNLLFATATSPAMMMYLDNWLSIGPDSLANGVNPANPNSKKGGKGLNENYGREVMELHTVGVNGGYSQSDVTALSAILTGWTIDAPNTGGGFKFDPKRHEPGPKVWFGYMIDEDGKATRIAPGTPAPKQLFGPSPVVAGDDSYKQGMTALEILAASPQTAHFISTLLVQYFVSDKPPASLVNKLTKTYLETNGDIRKILTALVESPEFNSKQYFHNKVKTPEEYLASAYRTTATDPQNLPVLRSTLQSMGMPLYSKLEPTGYYLTAEQWLSSIALVDRLNFAYTLTTGKLPRQTFDAPKLLAIGLMSPSSAGSLTTTAPVKPVSAPAAAPVAQEKTIAWEQTKVPPAQAPAATAVPTAGAQVTLRILEATMIAAPVSAKTNQLIAKSLAEQPVNADPVDTLNVLTALVMGSPEFQLR